MGRSLPGRPRWSLALGTAVVCLGACSGGPDRPDASEEQAAEAVDDRDEDAAVDTAAESRDGSVDVMVDLGHQVWHAGFLIGLDDVRFHGVEQPVGGDEFFVTVRVTFENLGDETRRFDGETTLTSGGRLFSLVRVHSELPDVPAGLSGAGRLVFHVDEDFGLDAATLVFGTGREQRSVVPLGPQGDEFVTHEPTPVAVSGEISLPLIDLLLTSGELRADRPVNYTQVEEGKRALTLHLEAVSRRTGSWVVFADDFALVQPSGHAVVPEGSGLGSIPGSDAGVRTPDLYVRFLVDDPPTGTYTLRYAPTIGFESTDGDREGSIEFHLD